LIVRAARDAARGGHGDRAHGSTFGIARPRRGSVQKNPTRGATCRVEDPPARSRRGGGRRGGSRDEERDRDCVRRERRPHARGRRNARATLETPLSRLRGTAPSEPT
jgi:hypothetical protein